MKIRPCTLIIALFFAVTVFNKVYAQSVFPIRLTDDGHILIQAEINGIAGDFLLGTGAGLTVITRDYTSGLDGLKNLDGGYTVFRATGERLDLDLYGGNEIHMGSVQLQKSALSIIDVDWPIDGILSLMSFKNQPFTIDFEQKTLCLESPESLAKRRERGHNI